MSVQNLNIILHALFTAGRAFTRHYCLPEYCKDAAGDVLLSKNETSAKVVNHEYDRLPQGYDHLKNKTALSCKQQP